MPATTGSIPTVTTVTGASIAVPAWQLRRLLQATIPLAEPLETMPELHAVHLAATTDTVIAFATDRYRAGLKRYFIDTPQPPGQTADLVTGLRLADAREVLAHLTAALGDSDDPQMYGQMHAVGGLLEDRRGDWWPVHLTAPGKRACDDAGGDAGGHPLTITFPSGEVRTYRPAPPLPQRLREGLLEMATTPGRWRGAPAIAVPPRYLLAFGDAVDRPTDPMGLAVARRGREPMLRVVIGDHFVGVIAAQLVRDGEHRHDITDKPGWASDINALFTAPPAAAAADAADAGTPAP